MLYRYGYHNSVAQPFSKLARLVVLPVISFMVAMLVLFSLNTQVSAATQDTTVADGQLVVQLNQGTDIQTINTVYGTTTLRQLTFERVFLLVVPGGKTLSAMMLLMQNDPGIAFVEPNYKMLATEDQQAFIYYDTGSSLQTGELTSQAQQTARKQWAFDQIDLTQSQKVSQGSSVTVAVIDTGVQAGHPVLSGKVLPGYNSIDGSSQVNDDNGHGTFVAGVVAQVSPEAKILPVKALAANGEGTVVDASEGLRYAADRQARVINMSMGLYQPSKLLDMAVVYAQSKESLVVASAGNSNTSEKRYPAAYPGVIGVAATDQQNRKASFSNFGVNSLVAAPGVSIYSAYYRGGYAYGSGTSFAAPQVTGLAAQVWALKLSSTAGNVSQQIQKNSTLLVTTDPVYGLNMGKGLINNYRTVSN